MEKIDRFKKILVHIYGEKKGSDAYERLFPMIDKFPAQERQRNGYFDQENVVLITYGDSLTRKSQTPLAAFREFAENRLKNIFSAIHFLPFFPFSSDDGFSVVDYFSINPELGSWDDVNAIGDDFTLMFDHVLNHMSAKNKWFMNYLNDREGYQDFAIEIDPGVDLSMVTRPRALPLLSEFTKATGQSVHVWTTFSDDQIDLNYESISVLEKMVEVLLYYIK